MKKIFTIVVMATMTLALSAQHIARTMNFEGTSRKYMEHIPTNSPDGSMPVVFLLHGLGDNCANFSSNIHFEDVAPNWIIITPEATNANVYGINLGSAWAAGVGDESLSVNLNSNVNDEGFILAILDSLQNNYNVDTDSIFVAGFSMGGFMSNKMAIKHADRIKAIASVSGTIGHYQAFEPTGNINTMHIHGTADETISYADASFSFSYMNQEITLHVGTGAEETVNLWRNYNECSAEPIVYNFEDTKNDGLTFEQYSYKNENTGKRTVFIKVNNGTHDWYNGSSNDIDYNTEIYKFFTGKINGETGIETNTVDNFSIYPNPAANILNVTTKDNTELAIFNATGKEIKHINATETITSIEISDMPNGLYFVVANGRAQKLTIAR